MNREMMMEHCSKIAGHNDAMAKMCRKLAKSHSKIADAHSDQSMATHYRDVAAHHENMAKVHDDMQEHAETMREKLANGSGAEQMETHADAGDILMNSAAARLLGTDGEFD